jgi:hypothetical protein
MGVLKALTPRFSGFAPDMGLLREVNESFSGREALAKPEWISSVSGSLSCTPLHAEFVYDFLEARGFRAAQLLPSDRLDEDLRFRGTMWGDWDFDFKQEAARLASRRVNKEFENQVERASTVGDLVGALQALDWNS